MAEECELTLLPKDMCSHCREYDLTPEEAERKEEQDDFLENLGKW